MLEQKQVKVGTGKNGNGNGHGGAERLSLFPEMILLPTTIVKRDGRVVGFDMGRIESALGRCFASIDRKPDVSINDLANQVVNVVSAKYTQPTVEDVQDVVETVLQAAGEYEAAKHYILYRAEHAKMRKERPIPDEVRSAFGDSDQYFPTQLQKFQFYDKYSRFNYDLGRRETWIETVDRAVDYLRELSQARLPVETYERVRRSMLEMRAMTSMRLLAMAGPAARRNNIAIYNCSYMPVDSLDSFVEAMIISMSGCGVGFSVENKYVEQFPRIRRQTTGALARTAGVEDSAEGWADALRLGLQTWFDGGDVKFDLSQLRPAGAALRTKGGRASGPEPFRAMLDFARARILARQGSFLRTIDAHDIMCAVGNAAVSGGVRRTAMISLFDFDDEDMRRAKAGDFERDNSQRWNANNSAVWPEQGLTQPEIMRVMLEMIEGGRGEPGIFNRQSALTYRPERRQAVEFGTNPCVTGETWVLTDQGPRQVTELLGQPFTAIVDGQAYHSPQGFWETGVKPVLNLKTREGYTLRLTANHKVLAVPYLSRKTEKFEWVEAGNLRPGDQIKLHNHREFAWEGEGTFDEGWLLGSLVGDGTFDHKTAKLVYWGEQRGIMAEQARRSIHGSLKARADLQGYDQVEHDRVIVQSAGLRDLAADYGIYRGHKTITPFVEQGSSAFYGGFLQGLFDADGTVIGTQIKGVSVRLAQSDLGLLHAAQRMLLRLGVASTIYEERRPAGPRQLPDGHGGYAEYETRADHELVIANDNLAQFADLIGFSDPDKRARLTAKLANYKRQMNRERFVATVESIVAEAEEVVYDCSVTEVNAFDANGLYVHNCGEILLRPYEFCNLSIAIARADDTYASLKDKVEVAAIIGTIQSMATHFPGLREQWKNNCEEERLLGVDINGQMDSPVAQDPAVQARLKQVALEVNRATAATLGINASAAVTCVKPSGNSSQLFDCSPGIHTRWAPYYVRNVRVSAHTPIFKVLRDVGVPMDPENGQTPEDATTWVIHFPVKAPEGAWTRKDRSALAQCEYWLQNKTQWTEHNPSVTITYAPDEVLDITKWVWEHREMIGGMTFLPTFDAQYDQMPYMEIERAEYERLAADFPQIDFAKLYYYEEEDLTTAAQELACLAGACDVDGLPIKK